MKKLILNDSTEITQPEKILDEQRKYYNLYTTKSSDEQDNTEFFTENIPKLNETERKDCDAHLSLVEIGKALKQLKNDKSPGNDGFTTNFYKFFWPDIKHLLFES